MHLLFTLLKGQRSRSKPTTSANGADIQEKQDQQQIFVWPITAQQLVLVQPLYHNSLHTNVEKLYLNKKNQVLDACGYS